MSRTLRTRLVFWTSVVVIAALGTLSAGVLWLHARWGGAQFDAGLGSLGTAISNSVREEIRESGNVPKAALEAQGSMDVPGRAAAIFDPHGTVMAAKWHGFVYDAAMWPADGLARPHLVTVRVADRSWRLLMRRERSDAGDYIVLVAGALDELARQHQLLARILLLATPLICLATAGASWWVTSSLLRPIATMAGQADAITAHSTDWRLDEPDQSDEVGQLARVFNGLLARLAGASRLQRQFMADASHELRTPVSVIHTAAEVVLNGHPREMAEYVEALSIVGEQSTRLSRLVDDMFVLARADAGGYRVARRLVDLDEIAAECLRAVSVLATARAVVLNGAIEPDVTIHADGDLLRRLITNLLDNAVRYSPAGGLVTLAVRHETSGVTIAVSDTGPGIPTVDRARIFDRFVRLDSARSSTSGAGLGLPIARWIAEQHGGTLTVDRNADGGSLFVGRLPATS